jgi:hypothetical protein
VIDVRSVVALLSSLGNPITAVRSDHARDEAAAVFWGASWSVEWSCVTFFTLRYIDHTVPAVWRQGAIGEAPVVGTGVCCQPEVTLFSGVQYSISAVSRVAASDGAMTWGAIGGPLITRFVGSRLNHSVSTTRLKETTRPAQSVSSNVQAVVAFLPGSCLGNTIPTARPECTTGSAASMAAVAIGQSFVALFTWV